MQEKLGLRIIDSGSQPVNLNDLLAQIVRERRRVLVNDALGLLVDVSDMGLFTCAVDPDNGRLRRAKITRIAKAKAPISYWAVNMADQATVTEEDITLFIQEPRGTTKLVHAEGQTKQIHTDSSTGRLSITMLSPEQLSLIGGLDELIN